MKGGDNIKNVLGVYTNSDYQRLFSYLYNNDRLIAIFWLLATETGFRVSDLLGLNYCDIVDGQIDIIERKTKKRRKALISHFTSGMIETYRQHHNVAPSGLIWPYTRQQIWRRLKSAGEMVELPRLSWEHTAPARLTHGGYSSKQVPLISCRLYFNTHFNQQHCNTLRAVLSTLSSKVS